MARSLPRCSKVGFYRRPKCRSACQASARICGRPAGVSPTKRGVSACTTRSRQVYVGTGKRRRTGPADPLDWPNEQRDSALRDLALFVLEVLSAHGAELLDLELLGHRPLVLGRRVVCTAAIAARHLDEVAHGKRPKLT